MSNDLIPYKPKPPVCTLRDGGVVITIWENRTGGKTYFNATMERVYEDKTTGKRKSSQSFGLRDMRRLKSMISRAIAEVEKRTVQHLK